MAPVIEIGQEIPNIAVFGKGLSLVNTSELCEGKRVMIIGVSYAFSTDSSATYLPEFLEAADEIKSKGIDEIVCISVNDPFVVEAWGKARGVDGKITMLADPEGNFTQSVGLEMKKMVPDILPMSGTLRSVLYNMIVNDKVLEKILVEPDETGLTCTTASNVIANL